MIWFYYVIWYNCIILRLILFDGIMKRFYYDIIVLWYDLILFNSIMIIVFIMIYDLIEFKIKNICIILIVMIYWIVDVVVCLLR